FVTPRCLASFSTRAAVASSLMYSGIGSRILNILRKYPNIHCCASTACMSASAASPIVPRQSSGRSKNRSGGDGRRRVVVLDWVRLEGKAFVEFGERDREADFRHVERVVVLQDKDAPSILRADVDGCADAVLLEHDVSLDGGRRLILS